MAKGTIIGDTFEQLAELGQSTAKASAKQIGKTISPINMVRSVFGTETKSTDPKNALAEKLKSQKKNHTELDFNKLQEKFTNKDKVQTDALRSRLFNMVKQSDERSLMEDRQKKMQQKQQETALEQQRKEQQQQQAFAQQQDNTPRGKERRSIFSRKKVADRQHAETKPATGKQ